MTQIGIDTYLASPRNLANVINQIQQNANRNGIKLPIAIQGNIANQIGKISREYRALDQQLRNGSNDGFGLQNLVRINDSAIRSMRVARTTAEEFGSTVATIGKRFGVFFLLSRALYGITNAFYTATSQAVEYDRELAKIAQLTDSSLKTAGSLDSTITGLSKTYGVSAVQLAKVGQVLGEAGRNILEINSILKAVAPATLLPTFTDLIGNIENLEAVLAQFKLPAGQTAAVLDLLNTASKDFNVTVDELFIGLQRAGAAFSTLGGVQAGARSGIDVLKEYISLFTAVISVSRESAEVVGTTFRSVTPRLQRPEVQKRLSNIGVSVSGDDGNFVGPFEAFKRIANAIKARNIDSRSPEFASIVDTIGAGRNSARVTAILTQFDRAERIQELLNQDALGSVDRDAKKVNQGQVIKIEIDKLREGFNAFIREIVLSGEARKALQVLTDGLTILTKTLTTLGPVLPTIIGLTAAISTFSALPGVFSGIRKGFPAVGAGILGRAGGGTVSTMLTPGERYFSPQEVKAIGAANLDRINKNGGVIPGRGNTDSYYAELPNGSFILRKSAVKGLSNGSGVGTPLSPDDAQQLRDFPSVLGEFSTRGQAALREIVFGLRLTGRELASFVRTIKVERANLGPLSGGTANSEARIIGRLQQEFLPRAPEFVAPLAAQPINLQAARRAQIRRTQLTASGSVIPLEREYLETVVRSNRREQIANSPEAQFRNGLIDRAGRVVALEDSLSPRPLSGRERAQRSQEALGQRPIILPPSFEERAERRGEASNQSIRPLRSLVNVRRDRARLLARNDQVINDTLGLFIRRPPNDLSLLPGVGNGVTVPPISPEDIPVTRLGPNYFNGRVPPPPPPPRRPFFTRSATLTPEQVAQRNSRTGIGLSIGLGIGGAALAQSKDQTISATGQALTAAAATFGTLSFAVGPLAAGLVAAGTAVVGFAQAVEQSERDILSAKITKQLTSIGSNSIGAASVSKQVIELARREFGSPNPLRTAARLTPGLNLFVGDESEETKRLKKFQVLDAAKSGNEPEFQARVQGIKKFIEEEGKKTTTNLSSDSLFKQILKASGDPEGLKRSLALSSTSAKLDKDGNIIDQDILAKRVFDGISEPIRLQAEGSRELNAALQKTVQSLSDFDGIIDSVSGGITRVKDDSSNAFNIIRSGLDSIGGTRSRISQRIVNPFANPSGFSTDEFVQSLQKIGNITGAAESGNFKKLAELAGLDSLTRNSLRKTIVAANPDTPLKDILERELDSGVLSGQSDQVSELLQRTILSSLGNERDISVGNAIGQGKLDNILAGIGGGTFSKSTEIFNSVVQALQSQQDQFIATQNTIDGIALGLNQSSIAAVQKRAIAGDEINKRLGINTNAVAIARSRIIDDNRFLSGRDGTDPQRILREIQDRQAVNQADPQINRLIEVLKLTAEETRELAAINEELAEVEAAKEKAGSLLDQLTSSSFEDRSKAGLGIQAAQALSQGQDVPLFILNQVRSTLNELFSSDQRVLNSLGIGATGQELEDRFRRQQETQGAGGFVKALAPLAFNNNQERQNLINEAKTSADKNKLAADALGALNSGELAKQQKALLEEQGRFLTSLGQQFFNGFGQANNQLDQTINTLNTAVGNIPNEIKIAETVVRVNFMGADMFKTLEPELKALIERSVRDAMRAQANPGAGGR